MNRLVSVSCLNSSSHGPPSPLYIFFVNFCLFFDSAMMMRFEHNRSCSLSSERASTFTSGSSVRSRSLERNSSHFVRSALYPYPPVSETYHRDHRRGKGEKSRKNMKWRSYSSVDRRNNSEPSRSHDRHSGRSRSSSRDRSDRHGKRRNRSRSRSESSHRSHDHHRRATSSSSRHFDRNPHFSDLPLEWWEREEDCKLAKEAHTDKIDYLWPSREDLVLETTLAEEDTVLEPNMFPCKRSHTLLQQAVLSLTVNVLS